MIMKKEGHHSMLRKFDAHSLLKKFSHLHTIMLLLLLMVLTIHIKLMSFMKGLQVIPLAGWIHSFQETTGCRHRR